MFPAATARSNWLTRANGRQNYHVNCDTVRELPVTTMKSYTSKAKLKMTYRHCLHENYYSTVILYTNLLIFIIFTQLIMAIGFSEALNLTENRMHQFNANYLLNGQQPNSIAPTIDYSHNMRILKLPANTPIGSLIYRLRGSDGDPNTRLTFGLNGPLGVHKLLDVLPVPESWNEADVYLKSMLSQSIYNLTVYVTDGNKTTQVESTVIVTQPEVAHTGEYSSVADQQNSTSANQSPFLNTKHIYYVPENTKPNELIGTISVLESLKSDLPVRFELRGRGSDRFSIKYVFGPKGQSKGELLLKQPLDYEKQNLFNLKILALNAWTDQRFDTRNVATFDMVIAIDDVQDTPPIFKTSSVPRFLRLSNSLAVDEIVLKVEAEDGDYADQRPIQYALDANSPLANYFNINKSTGEISLTKSINELIYHASWDQLSWSQLIIYASELADTTSYDHLWPPMFSKLEIPIYLVDVLNEAPKFLGGWQTLSGGVEQEKILHGFMYELASQSTELQEANEDHSARTIPVIWYSNGTYDSAQMSNTSGEFELVKSMDFKPFVLDLGLGSNGTFELSLEGPDKDLFRVEPSFPVNKQTLITVTTNPQLKELSMLFNYDQAPKRMFFFSIVAQDFGQPAPKSSRIKCSIDLINLNDNFPVFDQDLYTFSVYENAPVGTQIGQIRAYDSDGKNSNIKYTSLSGIDHELFSLDEHSGLITLQQNQLLKLDRERKSQYLLIAEASDSVSSNGQNKNFTKLLIQVLDVNDNAPQFLQSHYDAILMPDGQFYQQQPLIVKAIDADEPNSANGLIAYEIIAGNLNEQFSIDSVSGQIFPILTPGSNYLNSNDRIKPNVLPQIPPILNEPIKPFQQAHNSYLPNSGKILPSSSTGQHEVEEATATPQFSPRSVDHNPLHQLEQQLTSASVSDHKQTSAAPEKLPMRAPHLDTEQLPALDLLLNLESANEYQYDEHDQAKRSLNANLNQIMRVPPITTLIVRAHDFGIPLRSSTVKVNIFNQALLSRSVSVILNGTAESLEQRKELIERAFSSITGSKAVVESIDSLSDSSLISVARLKLAVPQHSLVDLTDLTALMNAIDYHPEAHQRNSGAVAGPHQAITHYIAQGDKVIPITYTGTGSPPPSMSSNITSGGFFTDVHSFALDNQSLERRLLIYIIIVGVCILALLLIWLLYTCFTRDDHLQAIKLIDKKRADLRNPESNTESYRQINQTTTTRDQSANTSDQHQTSSKTLDVAIGSPLKNNLAKINNEMLLNPSAAGLGNGLTGAKVAHLKPDHYSMYNGQVWFEPSNATVPTNKSLQQFRSAQQRPINRSIRSRRASSAPSANGSLDSAILMQHHSAAFRNSQTPLNSSIRDGSGQFFPNTLGYVENLSDLYGRQRAGMKQSTYSTTNERSSSTDKPAGGKLHKHRRGHRVAPMDGGHVNGAFEHDLETGLSNALTKSKRAGHSKHKSRGESAHSKSVSSTSCPSSPTGSLNVSADAVILDSDQELLGFDSTGTPIIATHTRPAKTKSGKALQMDLLSDGLTIQEEAASPLASNKTFIKSAPKPPPLSQTKEVQPVAHVQVEDHQDGASAELTQQKQQQQSGNGKHKSNVSTSTLPKVDLMDELSQHLDRRKEKEKEKEKESGQQEAAIEEETRVKLGKLDRLDATNDPEDVGESSISRGQLSDDRRVSRDDEPSSRAKGTSEQADSSLRDMKNGELLDKQSIFALAYNGLATDKLPA